MNQINDILQLKADELFNDPLADIPTPPPLKQDEQKNPEENPAAKFNPKQIKDAIYRIKDQLDSILRLLDGEKIKLTEPNGVVNAQTLETGEQIIEGRFNGEKMIDNEGKEYGVPANYASKSKLVEGDLMKLTITKNGSFIFKQIGPIDRKRLTGELIFNVDSGQYTVNAEGKTYKVLTASITFFKGKHGDEIVLVLPKDRASAWGAVDNIIKK